MKNKKTNECEIREVNALMEVGSDVLGEAFIGQPTKMNLKSEKSMHKNFILNPIIFCMHLFFLHEQEQTGSRILS